MQLTNVTTEPRSPYELERGTVIWHEDAPAIFLHLDETNGLITVQYLSDLTMQLVRVDTSTTVDMVTRAELTQ